MEEVINASETAGARPDRFDQSGRPSVNALFRGAWRSCGEFRCKLLVRRCIVCVKGRDSTFTSLIAIRNRFQRCACSTLLHPQPFCLQRILYLI